MFASVSRLLPERWRANFGRRTAAIVLTLLLELVLALVLLTLKPSFQGREESKSTSVFTMEAETEAPPEFASPEPAKPAESQSQPETPPVETPPVETQAPPSTVPAPVTPVTPPVAPAPVPFIRLSRQDMASADLSARAPASPPAPRRPMMGPPDRGYPNDTPRAEGTGPNGEPLYAAAWFREPYPEELRGYLSTASGPGWGLIACRTIPDWRVDSCVALGESPQGSNIARAVLAAAWQFRVRPPRIGGQPKIGEWVRIRIDYGVERLPR